MGGILLPLALAPPAAGVGGMWMGANPRPPLPALLDAAPWCAVCAGAGVGGIGGMRDGVDAGLEGVEGGGGPGLIPLLRDPPLLLPPPPPLPPTFRFY